MRSEMDEYRQRDSLSFDKVPRKKKQSRFLTFGLENPLISIGFIGLVVLAVILCVGSTGESESGGMSRADIGTIATHDYKASRDFTFDRVDQEATDRIRDQRVSEVLPIYRWDRAYRDTLLAKVHLVFLNMRNGLQEEASRLSSVRVACHEPGESVDKDATRQKWVDALLSPYADSSVFEPYLSVCALSDAEISEQLTRWTEVHRDSFVQSMGYVVDDTTYAYLASHWFAESIETNLREIYDVVLDRMIVSTRQAIDGIDDISVQWLEGEERNSKVVDKSEKSMISTLESSEMMFWGLARESFSQAPEGFYLYFKQFVRPNLTYDEAATERERQSVRDKTAELRVIEEYKKGQTIVARGNPIRASHYEIFEKMTQSQGDIENRTIHWISLITVVGVLLFMLWRSMRGGVQRQKSRDLVYFASGILVYALSLRGFVLLNDVLDSVYHWSFSILLLFPFAAGPMVMLIVVSRFYAYLFGIVTAVIASLIVEDQSLLMGYIIISSVAGCMLMERPKRSNVVLRYGAVLGAVSALIAVAAYLLRGANMTHVDYWVVAFLGLASGFLSAGVVTIGLPIAESVFGYVTSNKLLELSNLEHPALKALFMEAPGTYQHSIMVGTLNEAAADAIGANSILARVGGYYHDIGKVKNAQYFAENQRGDNPHNRLNPNMSALILKTHERDGLEIAKKYKLPQDIRDFIATHHGTSRIEYFYQRAKEQQERVHEEDYRYPGPRPQTRETGICMVSDMVEAAVRSLPDKSPDKILVLVHKLINHKFSDGQFDECDLTLRDLNDIANALIGILNAFYHHRPEYPDQKKEREKIEAEKREKAEGAKEKSDSGSETKDNSKNSTAVKDSSDKLEKADSSKVDGSKDKEAKATEASNAPKGDGTSTKDAKDVKEPKDAKSPKDSKDAKLSKEANASKDVKEDKESIDAKDAKDAKSPKESKELKESKPQKDQKDQKESKDAKDARDAKDAKSSKESNEKATKQEQKNSKGAKGDCSFADESMVESTGAVEDSGASEESTVESQAETNEGDDGTASDDKREVEALLKEGEADDRDGNGNGETPKTVDAESVMATIQGIQDAYDLTFSSKVDVFKRS